MKISPLGDELHFGRTDIQDMNLSLFGIWGTRQRKRNFPPKNEYKDSQFGSSHLASRADVCGVTGHTHYI